jgi:deoxyribonuclease IV
MGWAYAERLGELAPDTGIALSVHAPIAAFLGHLRRDDRKHRMAVGTLDHSAGLAVACGAQLVVIHPGFLLGRRRGDAITAVVEHLAELRARLEAKGRVVPFGVEVMGRVSELGTIDDVVAIASRLPWVRPVLDFAHLHAVTDGGFTRPEAFTRALEAAETAIEPSRRFTCTSPTSASSTATSGRTSPMARGRCAPSRWPTRSPASPSRRR